MIGSNWSKTATKSPWAAHDQKRTNPDVGQSSGEDHRG